MIDARDSSDIISKRPLRLTRTGSAFHGKDTHKRCGSVIYALLSSTFSFLQFSPMIWETGWNQTRVQTLTMPCHHLNKITLRRNQVESINYRADIHLVSLQWHQCEFSIRNAKCPQILKHPVCVKSASAQHGSAMFMIISMPKHPTNLICWCFDCQGSTLIFR